MSAIVIETPRLFLRKMQQDDYSALCKILKDKDVMYAYEGPFTDAEVQDWLDKQLRRYENDGFGLFAAVLKKSSEMIGQCGLSWQPWKDETRLEIGYLFQKAYWHKGYAAEAARACRDYAFTVLGADELCSIIRKSNTASQHVALRSGMTPVDTWTKHYRGVDMPHILYAIRRAHNVREAPNGTVGNTAKKTVDTEVS